MIYGLHIRGDDSLSSVTDDGHWKRATVMTYQTINLMSVSTVIWTIEEKVPGKNVGHMGASVGRRWLFPSRNRTFGIAIDLLLLDLHLWTSILHDCHDNLELDRSVEARQ